MSMGSCQCGGCGCKFTLIRSGYSNITLISGLPPETKETAWDLTERMAEGDCAGTFFGYNCYEATEATITHAQDKTGTKLIQAAASMMGRELFGVCEEGCYTVTKYTKIRRRCAITWKAGSADPVTFYTEWTNIVDKGSGTVSATTPCNKDSTSVFTDMPEFLGMFGTTCGWDRPTGGSWDAQSEVIQCLLGVGGSITGTDYTDCDPLGTFEGAIAADVTIGSASGSTISWDITFSFPGGYTYPGNHITAISFEAELSIEHTAAEVYASMVALANNWNLDTECLWRIDEERARAPFVTLRQTGGRSPDIGYQGCSYTETTPNGETIGAPFSGEPDWTFGFDVAVYENCDTTPAVATYGEMTDGTIIYHWATNWTNKYIAGTHPPGYGIFWDATGTLRMQKGLEVLEWYPSYNPCDPADERWLLDTGAYPDGTSADTYACIDVGGVSGNDITVLSAVPADFAVGKLVSIRGGDADGWIARISAIAGLVVTVDPILTGSEWTGLLTKVGTCYTDALWDGLDQADGMIGLLRYQVDSGGGVYIPGPLAIKGRVAVTVSTPFDGTKTIFSVPATNLITGDKVDIFNSAYTTKLANDIAVTWEDATHFSVLGNYDTGAWFISHGAPHYLWNTAAHTGNFVIQTTTQAIVDGALVDTVTNTDDIATGSCPVLACTPNDDAPAGAHGISFPGSISPTSCGNRSWVYIYQNMRKPTWQAPIACNDTYTCLLYTS